MLYFYNSLLGTSLYSNGPGQTTFACSGFSDVAAGEPCDMISAVDGNFYIRFPVVNKCCNCSASIVLSPNWMKSGTFSGESIVNGVPVRTTHVARAVALCCVLWCACE